MRFTIYTHGNSLSSVDHFNIIDNNIEFLYCFYLEQEVDFGYFLDYLMHIKIHDLLKEEYIKLTSGV